MKCLRYSLVIVLFPFLSWGTTRIINQQQFLKGIPDPSTTRKDIILVLGNQRVSIKEIVRARKKYSKAQPLYWLLSDDQWQFSSLSLNKDQKVLDFASQLQENFIQVLPENLCPTPALIHEKTYEIIVIDSSWFLFPHQNELFTKKCQHTDLDRFYSQIEEAILNAKLKPLVIVSHHAIADALFRPEKSTLSAISSKIEQSIGAVDGSSNPAYQKYQEKLSKMLKRRNNVLIVSANTGGFFESSDQVGRHIALAGNQFNEVVFQDTSLGVKIRSKEMENPILLKFNQSEHISGNSCEKYSGPLFQFSFESRWMRFFLGKNYRNVWEKKVTYDCFNLDQENLKIEKIGSSVQSPDFILKDQTGNFYKLRPIKKEVRVPQALKDTVVENILLDQQSSLNPLGFIIASSLAEMAGIPSESPKLVYVDVHQPAFSPWKDRNFQSGFYQFLNLPSNLVGHQSWKNQVVLEVVDHQEMVHRLENERGYQLDQEAYLKARLFDMLVGDWDRRKDQWYWMVIPQGKNRVFRPFPVDRDSAFYHSDGVVSWWRRRKWINYKLQDYGHRLKHPDPMMIQSLSMDHRYLYALSLEQWNKVVRELQEQLPPQAMENALKSLPISVPKKDQDWLLHAYQKRYQDLPQIAGRMRMKLLKSVDIVGSADADRYVIQSGPGNQVQVTGVTRGEVTVSNTYDSDVTKEIRLYGLDGDDAYKLNWSKYTGTKVRLIPGEGRDKILARDQKMKPKIVLYDDNIDIDSFYGFIKLNYNPLYNDFYSQVNQRKLNVLSPILFLASSNADTGFIIGGGVRYDKSGFQRSPWSSTNEIKANAVLNRKATNLMYQGTVFDIAKTSDLQVEVDAGLPRFYGSFFGLGNAPPDLNPNLDESYYWMRARHLDATTSLFVPLLQYISVSPQLKLRFRDYLIDSNTVFDTASNNQLDVRLRPGTNSQIRDANYYVGTGVSFQYLMDDEISGPLKKRVIRVETKWMLNQGFAKGDGRFQAVDANAGLTGYMLRSKTQYKLSGGYGRNFGQWEFFDAQFLGQGQNLRGFFMNRFAGSSRVFGSAEINQSILWRNLWGVITDVGLGAYFDHGRVFLKNDPTSDRWHMAVGGQTWVTFLNSFAFKAGYSRAISESQDPFWTFSLTTEL